MHPANVHAVTTSTRSHHEPPTLRGPARRVTPEPAEHVWGCFGPHRKHQFRLEVLAVLLMPLSTVLIVELGGAGAACCSLELDAARALHRFVRVILFRRTLTIDVHAHTNANAWCEGNALLGAGAVEQSTLRRFKSLPPPLRNALATSTVRPHTSTTGCAGSQPLHEGFL